MAIRKNVAKAERPVRMIVGIVLIPLGFVLTGGLWKPLCILVGVSLILTAFVGY